MVSETKTATADPTADVDEEAPEAPDPDLASPPVQEKRPDRTVRSGRLGRLRPVLRSPAFAVVLVLAVLAAGWAGFRAHQSVQAHDQARHTDQLVLAAARQEVLALTGLDSKTAQSQLNRAISGATGSFKQQMQSSAAAFKSVVAGDKVVSTGKIDGIGVKSTSDKQATVLVAAEATVHNSKATKGELRLYRMSVKLQQMDGKWLVSAVEMVS
jgi:Mce-associated membrane protein